MGNSSSKSPSSANTSPHATAANEPASVPTRRTPRRKDSVGTAGHAIAKGTAAAPTASLHSSHSTSQDRASLSRSRGRSQSGQTAQQRLQGIADENQKSKASPATKAAPYPGTPDGSRSPRPPLNVDTGLAPAPEHDKLPAAVSNKPDVSEPPTPYFLPSSQFGRPPRMPLPIEEELHAPDSPVTGSPAIRPADFTTPRDGQPQTDDDMPRSKSVLSSTTLDDDEDLDDVLYKTEDMKGPLVNTLLEWREGGHSVYVTGTFCGWVKKSRLHKNGANNDPDSFSAIIGLPPGTHHLTFFVDGVPRTARHLPTAVDYAGSLVNYVEVLSEDTPQPVKAKDTVQPAQQAPASPSGERRVPSGLHPPMSLPSPTRELKPVGTQSTPGTSTTPSQQPARSSSQKKQSSTAAQLKRTLEDAKKYHSEIPRFLLDWDAPEGSSRVHRAGAVMSTQPAPPSLPMFLTKSILSMQTPMKEDASVLAYPNHTVLNHLATSSIKDEVLATSATTRYKSKFVTTIVYRPTNDEDDDDDDVDEEIAEEASSDKAAKA